MATRGAIRCSIETSLPADRVRTIFDETLGKRRWAKELVGNPSRWKIVRPPSDAVTAAEWVPNASEERRAAIKPDSLVAAGLAANYGTTIALEVSHSSAGRTEAEMYTSVLMKAKNGKVNPVAVATVRNQMKRVASAVLKADASASATFHTDPALELETDTRRPG